MYGGDKDIDHANAMADEFPNDDAELMFWLDNRNAQTNQKESQ
jgi:hypothetical protein